MLLKIVYFKEAYGNKYEGWADEEGFFYPRINSDICVNCGKCVKICPQKQSRSNEEPMRIFAAKHRDMQVRMNSSSGGVFSALAQYVERLNGIIYGAAFDEFYDVVHMRATGKQWTFFRGSKYVQSDLRDTFRNIKEDLMGGKTVLFSGTPCQVAGLKSFLAFAKIPQENLITIDIICHGTPSPRIWKEWLKWKVDDNSINSINFRDKKNVGWHNSALTLIGENGREISKESHGVGLYSKLYFNHLISKPSCGVCSFASFHRIGDITLGDCWGIEKHHPQFDDDKGISLVMVNTEKAQEVWKRVEMQFDCIELTQEECLQPLLVAPSKHSPQRDVFWEQYYKYGFEYAAKFIGLMTSQGIDRQVMRIRRKLYYVIKRIKG